MRKICSSSAIIPNWHLASGDPYQGTGSGTLVIIASTASCSPQPKHKFPADELVLCVLQEHLKLMPVSYVQAGFSVEEMLHHIRILKELMQNGRKLGLLVTGSRKLPSYKGAAFLSFNNVAEVRSRPHGGTRFEIQFAESYVHSHSTTLQALQVLGDHVKVKRIQTFPRARLLQDLALAIVRIELCSKFDSIESAKGWIKLIENCCLRTPRSLAISLEILGLTFFNNVNYGRLRPNAIYDSTRYTGDFVNELLKKWWVNEEELTLVRQIGVGSSGMVYEGVYREHLRVAVKVIKSYESHFRREILALASISCAPAPPNYTSTNNNHILPLVGACRDSKLGTSWVVTKLMEGGSLHSYLQKERRLESTRVLQLALDIARGMLFLHSRGIIHMDLKTPNIFLDKDGSAVIGDLGCARAYNEKQEASKVNDGTYRWMAPEAFGDEGGMVVATPMMDVYNFGMVVWELVSCEVPFADYSPVQAAAAVVIQGLRPPIPAHCFPPFAYLIRKCWAQQAADRPTFAHILRMLHAISP